MTDNLIGKTLANRYHISELIGSGGMATVYKAECNLLNRDVAIKVLKNSMKDDPSAVKNFTREAQAAAKLSHNNIVSVFDVGEEDGINYMVMEYVKGKTLKKYIQENGALPWQEACDYAIQIGQALEAAHSKGVVHRDIKPQNILMTEDKELKVTDFGIANAATTETLTMGSSAMGSVHYISPEQARGGFTDARSDIYSLGIVLFEMLTGRVPFDGESAVSVALMHIEKQAPSVLDINPTIPSDLAKVVSKAISKDQISRYQSAAEFVDDLRAVLASEPVEIREYDDDDDDMGDTKKFVITDSDFDDEPKKKKNAKKTKKKKTESEKKADKAATLLAFFTIIVLGLLTFGGYVYLKKGTGEIKVPNFVNMTLDDAVKLAAEKGVTISDELEYSLSDEIDEGKIISQTPDAKAFIASDEQVHVVVSIGSSGGDLSVPYVKGLDAHEGMQKIMDEGLQYNPIEEPSDTVPTGKIIRQSPEAGTKLNKNDVVNIHISTGKAEQAQTPVAIKSVVVPDLKGKSQLEAENELRQYNLKLGSINRKDSDAPEGEIISQNPLGGKTVLEGSAVSLFISTGTAAEATFVAPTIAPGNEVPDEPDDEGEAAGTNKAVTKTYTFQMPEGEGSANVKITIDGDTEYEKVKNYGDIVSIDITGVGKKKIVTFINGKIKDEQTINLE